MGGRHIEDNAHLIVLIVHSDELVVVLLNFVGLVFIALAQLTVIIDERACVTIEELEVIVMFLFSLLGPLALCLSPLVLSQGAFDFNVRNQSGLVDEPMSVEAPFVLMLTMCMLIQVAAPMLI